MSFTEDGPFLLFINDQFSELPLPHCGHSQYCSNFSFDDVSLSLEEGFALLNSERQL
jgi:hypothetical protein